MKEELESLNHLTNTLIDFVVKYGFQILGAVIILVVGIKLAGWLATLVIRVCEKRSLDVTVTRFIGNVVKVLTLVFVIIVAIGKFGISIAPFIAALGALAFGSSFAIQGPLSNYGAGLAIIISRPFVVGNTITVRGVSGVVDEITLAATILSNEDEEKITIPNKHIVGEIIQNSFENRVVEASVAISYTDDPQTAIAALQKTLTQEADVCQEPPPQIGIAAFADSGFNIGFRYWVPTKRYFHSMYRVNLAVHQALEGAGITIPYPHQDVRVISSQNRNA